MEPKTGLDRYSRQMRFSGIGEDGQRRLLDSHVTLCGCGALGTVLANALVRAGVGHLRLVDRDFIETNNLQRQVLFDEHDVAENLPKAEAAARKLAAINSSRPRRAGRHRHRPHQHPRTGPGRRPDPRRHRQFRDSLSHQRCGGQARQALGLRRLHRQSRPDHDHPARRDAVPALRLRGGARAGRGRHLRDGRRAVADRQHRRQLTRRPRRSRSSPAGCDKVNRELIYIDVWENIQRRIKIAPLLGKVDCPVLPAPPLRVAGRRAGLADDQPVRPQRRAGGAPHAPARSNFEEMARHLETLGEVSYNRFLLKFNATATSSPSSPTAGRSSRAPTTWTRHGRCMRSTWGTEILIESDWRMKGEAYGHIVLTEDQAKVRRHHPQRNSSARVPRDESWVMLSLWTSPLKKFGRQSKKPAGRPSPLPSYVEYLRSSG